MTKKNYAEVMEIVSYYENNADLKDLHARARSWDALTQMRYTAKLPEHMTRGITVDMPSPRLINLRRSLMSTMTSYSSIVTVAPNADGTPNGELKTKADKVERGLSVARATWNAGGLLRADEYHQQLLGAYFVGIMSCGDITEGGMPWTVLRPDPLSCFFPVSGAPDRPKYMARRYTQMVREVQEKYAGVKRTEHEKAKPVKRGGKWDWEPLGADVAKDSGTSSLGTSGGDSKYGDVCEFVWLDDGEYIYHIALNDDKKTGEIVFCAPNLVGGCSALVICGDPTPSREVKEMLGPAFKDILQTTLNLNLIRSIRATKSLQAKPDLVVEMTPEAFAIAQDGGLLQQVQMEQGVPNMISVGGKPVPWKMEPDLDLDKLEANWIAEQAEYINSWREPTDGKTVADTTANAYLTAVESIRMNQTSLLKHADWLEAEFCKMALHSLKEYGRPVAMYASEAVTMKNGEIAAGGGVVLDPSDIDFDYTVNVTTKAQTDSDLRAREEHGMWRVSQGIGSREEVVEASYVDSTAQLSKLAKDAAYRYHEPTMLAYADAAWRDKVRLRAGILLPAPVDPMTGMATGDPSAGNMPMQPAAIGGPQGGAIQ